MPAQTTAVACDGTAAYDGTAAFPDVGLHPDAIGGPVQVAVTAAIAGAPLGGAGVQYWGTSILAHGSRKPNLGLTLPWAVAVPLGFVAAFFALRLHRRLSQASGWRGAIGHALDGVAVVQNLLREPSKHGQAFAGMGLYWIGEIFSLVAALHAFGSPRPAVAALIVGYATGYALTRRTLPFAGAGVVEALLPFALVWVGASLAPAVLAVFIYRFFNLWLPLIPSVLGMRTLREDQEPDGSLAKRDT